MLGEAFRVEASAELTPLQLPFSADERWLALEFPPGQPLGDERLLYTVNVSEPFDPTEPICGILVDEWTEVIPAREETTGVAFHFDRPNSEPPQAWLLALPAVRDGAWPWDELVGAVDRCARRRKAARDRAGSPRGTPYGWFLPATVSAYTFPEISISNNLLANKAVYSRLRRSEAMARRVTVVEDMKVALADRLYPAITRWNRLEGRPRTHDFDRALRAEVRDALWMLSRQWQLGEFIGDDAGSPVFARAVIDVAPLDAYRPDDGTTAPLPDEPLDATVERRPLPLAAGSQELALDLRLVVGRRWLKLLEASAAAPGGLSADYRAAYRTRYSVTAPDPTLAEQAAVVSHPHAWQQSLPRRSGRWTASRCSTTSPSRRTIRSTASRRAGGRAEARRRCSSGYAGGSPGCSAGGRGDADDAWLPSRLEYQFGARRRDDVVARLRSIHGGPLDWYALEREPDLVGRGVRAAGRPPACARSSRPGRLRRDARHPLVGVRGPAYELRQGSAGHDRPRQAPADGVRPRLRQRLVRRSPGRCQSARSAGAGIAVTTVFDERLWVEPAGPPGADGTAGACTPSAPTEPVTPRAAAGPAAGVAKVQESDPIEEVALVRDEMANMVWGSSARSRCPPGADPGPRRRAAGPSAEPRGPAGEAAARACRADPLPGHERGARAVASVRARPRRRQLARPSSSEPQSSGSSTVTRTLRRRCARGPPATHSLPAAYFVFEEEVPRAGAVVKQHYRRTRWWDGRVFTWAGVSQTDGPRRGLERPSLRRARRHYSLSRAETASCS